MSRTVFPHGEPTVRRNHFYIRAVNIIHARLIFCATCHEGAEGRTKWNKTVEAQPAGTRNHVLFRYADINVLCGKFFIHKFRHYGGAQVCGEGEDIFVALREIEERLTISRTAIGDRLSIVYYRLTLID